MIRLVRQLVVLVATLLSLVLNALAADDADADDELSSRLVLSSAHLAADTRITRLAFGSCYAPQLERRQIWSAVDQWQPQLMLLMGDNVYQSEEKAEPELRELKAAYAMLAAEPEFAKLRSQTAIYATWDDHDYGLNDAGAELPVKYQSEALFEHVWPVPDPDQRKHRDGIYDAHLFGAPGQRLQIILLDTRFFRSSLKTVPAKSASSAEPAATMLGAAQWRWLAEQLDQPADLRLLVSSIPVLSERAVGESWARMPDQRDRLLSLIATATGRVLLLSGDSHFAASYRSQSGTKYPLLEFTASSLNFPISEEGRAKLDLEDSARTLPVYFEANVGMIEIDWEAAELRVSLVDDAGAVVRSSEIDLPNLGKAAGR